MKRLAFLAFVTLAPINAIHALTIGFEDLATRESFSALGISDSYQGFAWGYGFGPGVANRTFEPDPLWGWAVATSEFMCCSAVPGALEGSSYGWNFNGPQSLWIDFRGTFDFAALAVAQGYPAALGPSQVEHLNSATLQLFGYDALDNLIATSAIATLTDTFQPLIANFSGITFLEIRSDRNRSWFSVDSIVVNEHVAPVPDPVEVPEPGTIHLFAVAAFAVLSRYRSSRQSAARRTER